jgi:hemerythrin-like domain-containing protein
MIATERLTHEHQMIFLVLLAAEAQVRMEPDQIDLMEVGETIDFFANFVDRCHHRKEEKHLFMKMEERGIRRDNLAGLLNEHAEGRRLIGDMRKRLFRARNEDKEALLALSGSLLTYVRLFRSHINKENLILYPMADQALTDDDDRALGEAFKNVEVEEMGEGVHEKYHRLAHGLVLRHSH